MDLHMRRPFALAILLHALVRTSSASISFPSIQEVIGFSTGCTLAYDTPVVNCEISDFQGIGGTGTCSDDCQGSLETSQAFIQQLCSGQQADGNSLIGQLFQGNVVNYLCGGNSAAASTAPGTQASTVATEATTSAPSTMTMATETAPPGASTTEGTASASSTASTAESNTVSTSSTTSTGSHTKGTKTSFASSVSVPTSIETATSGSTSHASSSRGSKTSSSSSATHTSGSGGFTNDSGGGSPFDNTSNAAAPPKMVPSQHIVLSCLAWAIFAIF